MPAPIRPTLFLGLGSTGVNIITQLHELVMEAYSSFLDDRGLETFPIFKYIVCDTDENSLATQEIPPWMKMEVTFCSLSTTNVKGIKEDFADKDERKLKAWLDPDVLKKLPPKITEGTSRIRQQGRLCLWENLSGAPDQVNLRDALNAANKTIRNQDQIASATSIVQDFYKAATGDNWPVTDPPVALPPRVFIVGTLCGGTGSSTFADVAQLVRSVFGLKGVGSQTMVQGVFTIPDGTGINNAAGVDRREIANAWASLLEMDFYMDNRFDYHANFPNDLEIGPTSDRAFDYVYLLSCTNEVGWNIRDDGAKQGVGTSLNHMIAMNLLAESLVGLFDRKEAIRKTHHGLQSWMKPNPQEHLAAFASFGMTSYWYPRYRIANAAACHAAEEGAIAKWVASPDPNAVNEAVTDAALTWKHV